MDFDFNSREGTNWKVPANQFSSVCLTSQFSLENNVVPPGCPFRYPLRLFDSRIEPSATRVAFDKIASEECLPFLFTIPPSQQAAWRSSPALMNAYLTNLQFYLDEIRDSDYDAGTMLRIHAGRVVDDKHPYEWYLFSEDRFDLEDVLIHVGFDIRGLTPPPPCFADRKPLDHTYFFESYGPRVLPLDENRNRKPPPCTVERGEDDVFVPHLGAYDLSSKIVVQVNWPELDPTFEIALVASGTSGASSCSLPSNLIPNGVVGFPYEGSLYVSVDVSFLSVNSRVITFRDVHLLVTLPADQPVLIGYSCFLKSVNVTFIAPDLSSDGRAYIMRSWCCFVAVALRRRNAMGLSCHMPHGTI